MNNNFSVAMSVYKKDNPQFFDRSLESITDLQTIKPSEINLVVDGPVSAQIDAVIEKYAAKYPVVNVIRLEQNAGLGNALKLAVEASSNELIARMDSDDVSLPTRFEEQLAVFQVCPDIDILGGNITEFINDESNVVSVREAPCTDADIRQYMKKRCPFNHMTVMFKKSAVQKAGGYIDWFWNEDYYLWLRMLQAGHKFANTGTTLVNVRVGDSMYQRRGGLKYFKSEIGLQKFMLKNKIINLFTFASNCLKRFIIQILLPKKIRGFIFRKFARKQISR